MAQPTKNILKDTPHLLRCAESVTDEKDRQLKIAGPKSGRRSLKKDRKNFYRNLLKN